MDSIRIDSGVKRISINDDPERVISFNPSDVAFAERFYKLISDFEAKQREYEQRAESLDVDNEIDERGLPANVADKLAFVREVCTWMHEQIDYLFGVGASKTIFGDVFSVDEIIQFFDGITPFIESSRRDKLAKYTNKGKRVLK